MPPNLLLSFAMQVSLAPLRALSGDDRPPRDQAAHTSGADKAVQSLHHHVQPGVLEPQQGLLGEGGSGNGDGGGGWDAAIRQQLQVGGGGTGRGAGMQPSSSGAALAAWCQSPPLSTDKHYIVSIAL